MATNEPKNAPTDSDAEMASWSRVESEMKTHDQAMVKDYAEDVDNLLVFAGLFSAVLTAFLVESYTLLQEDNSDTNKRLLTRISTQLETFSPGPNLLNPPKPLPLPSDKFIPTRAAIWINALWFLSLIFSLAAAFFGIRVRQWLREYMQWNAALAHPRDNVYVRQIRFEALESWKVLGSISIIPGLLELALVLFVSGIVIFLWTLDPTVAIVVTIAVALFLSAAATITVLPAFLKRCPYKSPTAWVCVLLFSWIADIPGFCCRMKAKYSERAQCGLLSKLSALRVAWKGSAFKLSQVQNWRGRDQEGGHIATIVGEEQKGVAAMIGIENELYAAVDRDSKEGYSRNWSRGNETVSWTALRSISEVGCLSRALTWVIQSSHNSHVHQQALYCCSHMHLQANERNIRTSYLELWVPIERLSRLYLLGRVWPASQGGPLHTGGPTAATTASSIRSALQRLFHRREHTVSEGFTLSTMYLDSNVVNSWPTAALLGGQIENREVEVIAHIFLESLQRVTNSYLSLTAIFEHICALLVLMPLGGRSGGCHDVLIQSFNNRQSMDRRRHAGGVRAALFELALTVGGKWFVRKYKFDDNGFLVERHDTSLEEPHLLLTTFVSSVRMDYQNPALGALDSMRIFVGLADQWLKDMWDYGQIPTAEIVDQMTNHVEHTHEHRYANCGYMDDLPWFRYFDHGKSFITSTWQAIMAGAPQPFRRLIRALQASKECGLLTGPIVKDLPFLLRLAEDTCTNARELERCLNSLSERTGIVEGALYTPSHRHAVCSSTGVQEEQANQPTTAVAGPAYEEVALDTFIPSVAEVQERQADTPMATAVEATQEVAELHTYPPGVVYPTIPPAEFSDQSQP